MTLRKRLLYSRCKQSCKKKHERNGVKIMRKSGRTVEPITGRKLKAVMEYLNSDMGYKQVAKRYKVCDGTIRYWVNKYRKEQLKNAKENNG